MKDFRKLKVWEKSNQLALDIYRATEGYPKAEVYGLMGQMRRAAVSIPLNLAEGCGRGSDADMGRFVQIALGSASELEYRILISRDLKLMPAARSEVFEQSAQEVKRMLTALQSKLKADG